MHVITQKRIWEAKMLYPNCGSALDGWYRIISSNQFNTFSELKKAFKSVDKVDNYYVFDIGGNKLRLIANIHFNRFKVYIRYILAHKEYDKNFWKK
jgi:mRNA interferase HigB